MSVVFAATYRNEGSAEQGRKSEEHACEVGSWAVDVALPRDEQREVAQPTEREAAMSARKTPPPIMQHMVVLFGAHFPRNELVCGGPWLGLASRDEIWSWSAHGVLNNIRDEQGQDHAYEPAEDCDVGFVSTRAEEDGP